MTIREVHLTFSNRDEEDVWDEEDTYLEMLAEEVIGCTSRLHIYSPPIQSARLREAADKTRSGDDAADSSSDEEDVEEELGYISPLDVVNPYVTFKRALTSAYYVC